MGMKCWKTTFNAQGSRPIITALQVGVLKIYATIMEVLAYLKKNEKMVKFSSPQKLKSPHHWMFILFIFWISSYLW
jgi:hypothetical protein